MPLPAPTMADLRVKAKEPMDTAFFDRRSKLIVEAFGAHRAEIEKQGAATDQLIALGLARINEVLGPLLTSLNQAAELGFLIGVSTTSQTLTEGAEPTFEISEETRSLFKPTPYLTISRSGAGAEDQFAIAKLLTYNAENGGLSVEIISIENLSGAHADWVISASSGLPLSVMGQMEEIAALDQVATDRDAVEAALETVSTSVLSVAGKTGDVILSVGDISGLLTALAGKAASSHNHAGSDITSGTINPDRLGTGTRTGSKFLRDDGQYALPPGGGAAEWGALTGNLADQADLVAALGAKSNTGHGHALADITGLIDALAAKAGVSHTHAISAITGLVDALAAKQAASANLDAWSGRVAPASAAVGIDDAQTLKNKRVQPRVATASAPTSFSWNSDSTDRALITGLTTSLTMPADSGTPTDGQSMVFRIQDNGSQRTISWTTNADKSFRAVGVSLPANTTAGKTLYVGCMYNAAALRWDVLSINQQA